MTATPGTPNAEWPYDAPADHLLTAHRIPVAPECARWNYIVWFDADSPAQPDDREVALLRSFLTEYIEHWYNETWKAKMARRPFDIDGGANGTGFIKYAEGSWGYQKRSWRHSYRPQQMFAATGPNGEYQRQPVENPLTLAALMDRIHQHGAGELNPKWEAWKAAHPEVFGGAS